MTPGNRPALTTRSAARCFRVIRFASRRDASGSPSSSWTMAPSTIALSAKGPSSSVSSRCSSADTRRLNERTACEPIRIDRTLSALSCESERGSMRSVFLSPRDLKSALADGDRHDVLPLREPQRRIAGMVDRLLEREVAALERQHCIACRIGRRCKAGVRRAVVLPIVAPALSVRAVSLPRGECGDHPHGEEKGHYAVWFETYLPPPPSPSLGWPAARRSA